MDKRRFNNERLHQLCVITNQSSHTKRAHRLKAARAKYMLSGIIRLPDSNFPETTDDFMLYRQDQSLAQPLLGLC